LIDEEVSMQNSNLFLSLTPIPLLSFVILVLLALAAMYLARKPFHRCMAAFGLLVYHSLRLASFSIKMADRRLRTRNQEVLLSAGLELSERRIEREFERLGNNVGRELQGFPKIQRGLSETMLKLEEDYGKCAEIPQHLPDWVKVIDAVANIQPSGDRMVINMLEQVHETLVEQHKSAAEQFRRAVSERHQILSRLMPSWRRISHTLEKVEATISRLGRRSEKVDRLMDDYEKLRLQTDTSLRQLSSSTLTQFFISGMVLVIIAVGAIFNFNLLAIPLSEMVGGNNYLWIFKSSDVFAMFIVCLEVTVGVLFMDAIRITHLFPIFGGMDDRKRKIMYWMLLIGLTVMAFFEASLAYVRDQIAGDMEALRQTLSGVEISEVAKSRIPTFGAIFMGFMLPVILMLGALPVESFVTSSRTVLGVLASFFLRILAFLLRLAGSLGFYLGRLLINIYDLIIFLPLWIENLVMTQLAKPATDRKNKTVSKEKTTVEQVG
jgi:hypothetical protein